MAHNAADTLTHSIHARVGRRVVGMSWRMFGVGCGWWGISTAYELDVLQCDVNNYLNIIDK